MCPSGREKSVRTHNQPYRPRHLARRVLICPYTLIGSSGHRATAAGHSCASSTAKGKPPLTVDAPKGSPRSWRAVGSPPPRTRPQKSNRSPRLGSLEKSGGRLDEHRAGEHPRASACLYIWGRACNSYTCSQLSSAFTRLTQLIDRGS